MRSVAVLLTTVLGATVITAPAHAATSGVVTVQVGGVVRFTAAAKARNTLVITVSGRTVTFDDRVRLRAGHGCTAVKGDKTKARCPYAGVTPRIEAHLRDGADTLTNRTWLWMRAWGGTGDDTLTGGSGTDQFYGESGDDRIKGNGQEDRLDGGPGNDVISGGAGPDRVIGGTGRDVLYGGSDADGVEGGPGADRLYGNAGDDALDGGAGSDLMSGGAGSDTVYYRDRTGPVTADLDGKADDGEKGERDTITTTVENLVGGIGDDVLTGNDRSNRLSGGSGADRLYGLGGRDWLRGDGGRDRLSGGDGNDRLVPDHPETEDGVHGPWVIDPIAADVISGGPGTDMVDYSERVRNPVTVDLDGRAGDDGRAGEGDTVGADVEEIVGTTLGDRLIGNDGPNTLYGIQGDDVLIGLGGEDRLYGDEGDDDLSGEDTVGDQADVLDGGSEYPLGRDRCRVFPLDVAVGCEL
ncbi:calcium-binding protein [Actinoplanes couchii]|uniref:Hemolysin-type calcium-binding region n=1 Tax=Actinoplanes couchii TaxID=403638 RepID=A0ABQ3XTW5_9ACTN|nr:calcium-binding protein [Actinoplanes couchii]MDR6324752.1 Ca2+-binding RTX toxin-like protein [Actinoplanes couchii]GID61952.1 hypothetical protein Aco03nite_103560 [Actinoplanes couchii]